MNKLKVQKNTNRLLFAIILILMLTISGALLALPTAKASDQTVTYAFIEAQPNPVGVNQQAFVNFWLSLPTPNAGGPLGDRFSGFTVLITKPDGTTQTMGPYTSNDLSSAYFSFTPTETGTYTFQFNYPGQKFSDIPTTYEPSNASTTLVVQQQPAISPTQAPLPTTYWSRPINAMNEGWSSISGNWLMPGWDSMSRQFDQGCAYDPYTTAPTTAHILWTKPLTFGGQAGGEFGTVSYYDGRSYEQFFRPPVIISGRLYYDTIGAEEPINSITCVDLNNGETLFTIPNASLSFGQIYNYVSPNQAGTFAYLWDTSAKTTWRMFDAWTGQYMLSIANIPSGTILLDNTLGCGPGDVLVYSLNSTAQTLTLWNSSEAIPPAAPTGANSWEWRPYNYAGQTLNGTNGIQWVANLTDMPVGGSITQVGADNTVYISNGTAPPLFQAQPYVSTWCGYSMTNGKLLWGPSTLDITSKIPPNSTAMSPGILSGWQIIGPGGIYPMFVKETMQWYAWNVTNGQFLWGPTPAYKTALGTYDMTTKFIVNGIIYNSGYDGMIHAFNLTTGQPLWTFSTGDAGTITPYGTWPLFNGLTIAGGELFATCSQHGNGVMPLYEGMKLFSLDATTGQQIWNILGWFEQPAIADGILVSHNCYDNQIYAFGKGPSATSVVAPMSALTLNSAVTIRGSVTDQSPGANDTPAVSDASMSAWMAYLYEQQPMPTNATGVQVTLTVVDPNGNTETIGTTTTDSHGNFGFMWTPPVPGLYQVIATFAGTNSYYGSSATTYFSVEKTTSASAAPVVTASSSPPSSGQPSSAPTSNPSSTTSATASPSPAPAPSHGLSSEIYIIAAAAASIVIIVVAAAAAVLLRRRRTK